MTVLTIMAGGEGTRLRPLTFSKPKPLIKVLNIPVLTYTFERIKNLGYKEVFVTLHYLPNLIISCYKDGFSFGFKINYSIEKKPLGTAGGVKNAVGKFKERTIVVSGDLITDFDIKKLYDFHLKSGSLFTIALKEVKNPYQFGILKTNEEGKVIRFLEKPSKYEIFSNLINAGIYIIEPEVFKYIPEKEEFDFSKNLIPLLLSKKESIYALKLEGYWQDIGTIEQYFKANKEILTGSSKELLNIAKKYQNIKEDFENVNLHNPCFINSEAKIDKESKIGPYTIIDKESKIGKKSNIKFSIIGQNSCIEKNCRIFSSIISDYVFLNENSILNESVIASNSKVGKNVKIENSKIWPKKEIQDNLTIINKQLK